MSESDKTGTVGKTSDNISRPHTEEELVPQSVPLTIPYFEVYRTNELEYVEYQSPFLNQSDSSSGGDSEDGESTSEESESTTETKRKLWTTLANIVSKYFPHLKNKNTYIQKLRDAGLTWRDIALITNYMASRSKINGNQNRMIEEVLEAKEKATHLTRGTYSSGRTIIKAIQKGANTKKGKILITALSNDKNDIVDQKIGTTIQTRSKKEIK